jgi:hypothetical protein
MVARARAARAHHIAIDPSLVQLRDMSDGGEVCVDQLEQLRQDPLASLT